MNTQRRKLIEKCCNTFAELDNKITECRGDMETLKEELETLRDEEQEYLDNMPENLHGSDKYSTAENSIQEMETLIEWLDNTVLAIDESPNSDDLLNVI